MNQYQKMSTRELQQTKAELQQQYDALCQKKLMLNMSRGIPCSEQLALSMPMLHSLQGENVFLQSGVDERNYGQLDGLTPVKQLFADLLDVFPTEVLIGGNSSLNLMYDTVARAMMFGVLGSPRPWNQEQRVKCLCPVPGYDRHFAISSLFGIEMIPVEMTSSGPNMGKIEQLVATDPLIKFIWCVPKYANPLGVTYSAETVTRFATMQTAAPDFRIIWDNAYCVHDLTDTPDILCDLLDACKQVDHSDRVFEFVSTSKITFPGSGVSAMIASVNNLTFIKKQLAIQTIGYDKMNQLAHLRFFKDPQGILSHMKKHRAILAPKFELVISKLEKQLLPLGLGTFHRPNGGYFVSFDAPAFCAKRIVALCKQAGVTLTDAGATYPAGQDPQDSNIRIAPTFPSLAELDQAMDLFCLCVKIATVEQLKITQ